MKIIREIKSLQQQKVLQQGSIAFVPTMGNLHSGHLELVKKAKDSADHVIVSIFVNPLQFGPSEDFLTYPRTLETDIEKLNALSVDLVFCPEVSEIYPGSSPSKTQIIIPELFNELCGVSRPHFFYGVATVVTKLFNIIQPDFAVFGEKDFQQLTIIKQLVKDLNFPITILSVPTVREADSLAMSSRNQYLTADERKIAPDLYRTLLWIKENFVEDKLRRGSSFLIQEARDRLEKNGFTVDYLTIRSQDTLQIPSKNNSDALIALTAAFLGKTRLIDNIFI